MANDVNLDELFVPVEETMVGGAQEPEIPQVNFQPAPEPPQPLFSPDSLGGRIGSKIEERIQNVQESTDMMNNNEQTYLETAAQGFGQVIQANFDAVSETALGILSSITPDEAEAWLKEQIDTGSQALMDTETAQGIYQVYRNLTPRARKDLEAAVNIGLGWLPLKSRVGEKLVESGVAAEKRSLGKYLLDQSPSAKQARIQEKGMDRAAQTTLNREDSILNTVMSIKGITASTPRPKMMAALNTEIARLGSDIKTALSKVPTRVPKGTLTLSVNRALSQFKKDKPEFAGKDLKPIVDKVQRAYLSANKSYNGRPEDLLRVRREFDKIIEKVFKKDVFAGDDVSREVVAVVRNTMNEIMQNVAPDAKIRAAMQRQHHAFSARENLGYNMAREKDLGDRVLSKLEHHPMLTTSLIAGGGLGAKLAESEGIAAGALALGAGYLGTRPIVRKTAGEVLKGTPIGKSLFADMATPQEEEQ